MMDTKQSAILIGIGLVLAGVCVFMYGSKQDGSVKDFFQTADSLVESAKEKRKKSKVLIFLTVCYVACFWVGVVFFFLNYIFEYKDMIVSYIQKSVC